ncbi:MAG: terminase family protein [Verrucomicrobiota bacterium]
MKRLPDHAKGFRGRAKNIPERDAFMLPYQARWIQDASLMKLMEKSRRVGISYGTAYDLVRQHSREKNRNDSWVSSRDEASAKLFLMDCKTFARSLKIAAEDLGERVLDDKGNSAYVLRFANTTDINSVSSNPDAFAGKGGNVTLDEFALRDDPRIVYSISSPSIDWGGRLAIISTHRGSGNFFNKLIREIHEKDNPKNFSLHRVTLQDALDQHFLWKLQTKLPENDPRLEMDEADYFDYQRSRAASEEVFLQEYMCVPADDAGAFIEFALIDACMYPPGERWEFTLDDMESCTHPLFAGVDIGRKRDLTSMTVVEKVGGQHFIRKRIDLQGIPFSQQEAQLWPWFERCHRICIDNTGLGMQFAERSQERFGKYKVEPVSFTGPVKEELAYPLRSAFEDKAIRIPFGDDLLVADLRKVRKETTAAGNIRFVADGDGDGHADRFWSMALALHAGKQERGPMEFEAVERPRRNRGRRAV